MPILGTIASQVPANLPTGSFESIQTVTVGAGGASTIDFTSIPSTYKHLQIRYIGRTTVASSGTDDILITFNSSSSSYAYHRLLGDGSSGTSSTSLSSTKINLSACIPRGNENSSVFGTGIVDILDYASSNKNKTTRALYGVELTGSGGNVLLSSGLWYVTPQAVTSISLAAEASHSFAQYSRFALYGIKGA